MPLLCHGKGILEIKNIAFENIDVGNNQQAAKEMLGKSDQMGVPVIDIDEKLIIGFDKEAISKELEA